MSEPDEGNLFPKLVPEEIQWMVSLVHALFPWILIIVRFYWSGMDYGVPRPRSQLVVKVFVAASLTALCMFILRQPSPSAGSEMVSTCLSSRPDRFICVDLYESNWNTTLIDLCLTKQASFTAIAVHQTGGWSNARAGDRRSRVYRISCYNAASRGRA